MSTPDGPVPDPFADDEAFAALIASLTSDGVPTRLILLGDMLVVLGLSAEVLLELDRRATATLLTIARKNGEVRGGRDRISGPQRARSGRAPERLAT